MALKSIPIENCICQDKPFVHPLTTIKHSLFSEQYEGCFSKEALKDGRKVKKY